jgi:hypothetical protein
MLHGNFNDYTQHTRIYRKGSDGEIEVGFVAADGAIYKLRWGDGVRVGSIQKNNVFRTTRFDERELGSFSASGTIHSHGLFEGGAIGWVEADGTVIQAGLIFGEEEIGRVEGEAKVAAGAALLLLFLVDEQEESRRTGR